MYKLEFMNEDEPMVFSPDDIIRRFQLRGLRRVDGTEIGIIESFQTRKECKIIDPKGNSVEVPIGAHVTIDSEFNLGFISDEDMTEIYFRDVDRKLESKEVKI